MTDERSFPPDYYRLRSLWEDIKPGFFVNKYADDSDRYDVGFSTASWAWVPDIQELLPEAINRKGEVLLGPFFSSVENPWPVNGGEPMIPLAQIDLDNASKLGDVYLGTGLLQVFCSVKDKVGQSIYTRVIDRSSVELEELTAAPIFNDDIDGFASVSWAQKNSKYRHIYGEKCPQITGYSKKKFTLWMPSQISEEFDLNGIDKNLREKVEEFDQILEKNSDEWSPGGFHLFGTFYPIQYYPDKKGKVFFTLESEYGFKFGDGQAQIFYAAKSDLPKRNAYFSFDWSCY